MKPESLTILNIGPFLGKHLIDFSRVGEIFLISGKTGAGKTTIFDAISYAFYGDASGERKGIGKELRSHFAQESEESLVQLCFTLKLKRYRITRTLPCEKLGTKSGKLQAKPEEVCLEEDNASEWKNISCVKKSDTDEVIKNLIGLSYDEFSKIILLPQGEFARFLRQNSTERKSVLSKLFPVQIYTKIQEQAKDKTKELKIKLDSNTNTLLSLKETYNPDEYVIRSHKIQNQIKDNKIKLDLAKKETAVKYTLLEKSNNYFYKISEKQKIEEKLASLKNQEEKIQKIKEKIALHKKTQPLYEQILNIEKLENRLTALTKDKETAQDELKEKTEILNQLSLHAPQIEKLSLSKDDLIVQKNKLEHALELEKKLDENRVIQENLNQNLKAAKLELKKIQVQKKEIETKINDYAPLLLLLKEREEKSQTMRDALEQAKNIRVLSEDFDKEKMSEQAHLKALKNANINKEQYEQDLQIARTENEVLIEQVEFEKKQDLAFTLSKDLLEGKACPVCGSTSHPYPASKAQTQIEHLDLFERIEAGKRNLQTLEKVLLQEKTNIASIDANLSNARNRMEALLTTFCQKMGEQKNCIKTDTIPSLDVAKEELKVCSQKMQIASDELSQSRKARDETDAALKIKENIDKQILEKQDVILSLEKEKANIDAIIISDAKQYQAAFDVNDFDIQKSDAQDSLEICKSKILEIDAQCNSWKEQNETIKTNIASLKSKIEYLEQSNLKETKELNSNQEIFNKACLASQFELTDATRILIKNSVLTQEEHDQIAQDIESFAQLMTETQTQLKTLEQDLDQEKFDAPEVIQKEITNLEIHTQDLQDQIEIHNSEITSLESLHRQFLKLEEERVNLTIEHGKFSRLSNDLSGANPLKTSFDAWILGMYLEEITSYANTRLLKMSEGRYHLQLNDSYRKGNNLSGLDIDIFDSFTGRARPTATLSGGETFMASISLALGLADSIQSRAGGIQLDAIFIDEGFGSLDESSLDKAISILDEIRGHRMVGMISHVGDLKNRIPNHIEVIKTSSGSYIGNL